MTRVLACMLVVSAVVATAGSMALAQSDELGPREISFGLTRSVAHALDDDRLRELRGSCSSSGFIAEPIAPCTEGGCIRVLPGYDLYHFVFGVRADEQCDMRPDKPCQSCYVAPNSSRCAYSRWCGFDSSCDLEYCMEAWDAYEKMDTAMLSDC